MIHDTPGPRMSRRGCLSSREHTGMLRWMFVVALLFPAPASAASARVAALQVGLRAHAVYAGTIDGLPAPPPPPRVRRCRARAGLVAEGVAGPRTRRALGALGRHPYGSRPL